MINWTFLLSIAFLTFIFWLVKYCFGFEMAVLFALAYGVCAVLALDKNH
jgi:hypothetical protein